LYANFSNNASKNKINYNPKGDAPQMTAPNKTVKTVKTKKNTTKKATAINPLKLSLGHIIDEDSQFDELITVTFDDGRFTEVYKIFREKRINEMMISFAEFIAELGELERVVTDQESLDFLNLHIIQYFSTIVGKIPTDITQKLDIYNKMLDNQLIKKTFESFDETQIVRVYKAMTEKLELVNKLLIEDEDFRNKYGAKIVSEVVEDEEIEEQEKSELEDGFYESGESGKTS